MRVAIVFSFVGLVSIASACLPTRLVARGERPTAVEEGYVAVGVDVEAPLQLGANYCVDGNVQRCLSIAPRSGSDRVELHAVPPGNYCLTQMLLIDGATSMDVLLERRQMECFPVVKGAIAYPGHLQVRIERTQFDVVRYAHRFLRRESAAADIQSTWPGLDGVAVATPTLSPAPTDPMMQMR